MTALSPRDWTCEKCTEILVRTFTYTVDPATIAAAVTYLQGDCFCGGPATSRIAPPFALPVLAQTLTGKTDHLCQEAIGVC